MYIRRNKTDIYLQNKKNSLPLPRKFLSTNKYKTAFYEQL